jgi:5-methylcytosine-specific restriction endonuclease McrBC GTP-binding regulatory subunit McrB
MTAVQICALIAIALMTAGIYWLAYRNGFSNGLTEGYAEGYSEGIAVQSADKSEEIRNLTLSLKQVQNKHEQLYDFYKRALEAAQLGEPARITLLEIAEKLRIAAETFAAFRTGKKLERETRALRDQALVIAALLEPADQENAA